jgi:DNA replication and repair protein RecF
VRVETLSTTHFRNLDHAEISFAPGVNLIVGENGHGKTNLLEAVYFFKLGRSFRTRRNEEMIRFEESYCRTVCSCSFADGSVNEFAASIERNAGKKISVSGETIEKLTDLVGRYPVVLFGPNDLGLVSGQPSDRRRFIDVVGSMTDGVYLQQLKEYRRILNQRNAALRMRASRKERESWNIQLVDQGCALIRKRMAITSVIEGYLRQHAVGLEAPFTFSLEYDGAIVREGAAVAGNGREPGLEELREVFETRLLTTEAEELRRGTTLSGPHRDDVIIKIAGRDVRKYGSQGQRRLLAILLKLSELTHLETELGETCVLLLDDVFSEFDPRITVRLQKLLDGGRQVFVTSPIPLNWTGQRKVRVFEVFDGRVKV